MRYYPNNDHYRGCSVVLRPSNEYNDLSINHLLLSHEICNISGCIQPKILGHCNLLLMLILDKVHLSSCFIKHFPLSAISDQTVHLKNLICVTLCQQKELSEYLEQTHCIKTKQKKNSVPNIFPKSCICRIHTFL